MRTVTPSQALTAAVRRQTDALELFRVDSRQVTICKSKSRERLVRGGNRSGKTTITAAMLAAAICDRPLTSHTGEKIDIRRPHQKGRPLTVWLIGYKNDHIGQTLYRVLFRAGLFKIIKDEETGLWRSYREETDKHRSMEAKQSPPLIPPRYIKGIFWENRGERVFTKVEIVDPSTKELLAEIYAFSSMGEVKTGDPVDIIWIDEAIAYASHYAEWQARLIDRQGWIVWSSWPRMTNRALCELTDRAELEREHLQDGETPLVDEIVLTMSGNPHLPQESKDEALAGWSEDERRARDLGEYLTDNLLMYGKFSRRVHTAISADEETEDELSRILRARGGEPPADWTRELILDPGTTHPAVLLCAVPPPELGNYMVPYQEIYLPRLDADDLAARVRPEVEGYWFERFIVDGRAARQTPMGFSHTISSEYSRAFESQQLRSRQTGFKFTPGSDDVQARIRVLQGWLTVGKKGFPKLRIVVHRCPQLCKQLERYEKGVDGEGQPTEKPSPRQNIDVAVCLEYWASRDPLYVEPPGVREENMGPAYKHLLRMRRRRESQEKTSKQPINCGPPTAA